MSRLSSQGSIIRIQAGGTVSSTTVSAATKAAPCVLTVGATPPVVGDIVVPRNTGFSSLDGMPFKVKAVVTSNVTLEDSDTTGETGAFAVAGATIDRPTFIELCRSNFVANSPAGAVIDVTTLCDDAHRIVAGLPAVGTWTAAGFYDKNDAALFRARDVTRTGAKVVLDVMAVDGSGWCFMVIVNTFDINLGVNAAINANLGGQIDGRVNWYATPPAGYVVPAGFSDEATPPEALAA
jgi:hypothetical protein